MSGLKSILIAGGTRFIGRVFCEQVIQQGKYRPVLFNRGITNPDLFSEIERIRCDRNDADACRVLLGGQAFDHIVDFSAWTHSHVENLISNCRYGHYTLLSSSAVDLSWPEDELFPMAQNKLWCEHLVQSLERPCLIVRPGFVVGKYDNSQRFERRDAGWVWKGTTDPVRPVVDVQLLVNTILQLIQRGHTGIVRAGYSKPRLWSNPALSHH
jgi:2'-hydroxyisoflavone reductase